MSEIRLFDPTSPIRPKETVLYSLPQTSAPVAGPSLSRPAHDSANLLCAHRCSGTACDALCGDGHVDEVRPGERRGRGELMRREQVPYLGLDGGPPVTLFCEQQQGVGGAEGEQHVLWCVVLERGLEEARS